jgi:hypothetical protein
MSDPTAPRAPITLTIGGYQGSLAENADGSYTLTVDIGWFGAQSAQMSQAEAQQIAQYILAGQSGS